MKLPKAVILLTLLLTSCLNTLYSQDLTRRELVRTVQNADIFFYYDENYEKAASIYGELHKKYPGNANFAAKLGICCLNIDGRHKEALHLLRTASDNVVDNDHDYIEFGEKAPLDTYLYLAIALHMNDNLEEAIRYFTNFKNKYADLDIFKGEYIDNQIRDCRHAMSMKKKALTIISGLFVPWLANYPGACNPVLSKDDSVFIFTQRKGENNSIMCSYKKDDSWSTPADITQQLGGYTWLWSNSVNGDGSFLILYMDDGGDGNLYFSERNGTSWSKIKRLGKKINTIYWESHGFITPDANTLYFSSNRPGGEGDLDIWISEKDKDGEWETPVNCGNTINTPYNEDTPFYDEDTQALLFSSSGHISMGGYDVFRSVLKNNRWTNPTGMPFAFNTTLPNTFFILNNNAPGFITSLYDAESGSRNIFTVAAVDPADEITTVEASVELSDEVIPDVSEMHVRLIGADGSVIFEDIQADDNGKYRFEIKPGDYELTASYPGYRSDTVSFNLPLFYMNRYLSLNATLVPEQVAGGILIDMKTVFFGFDSYKLDNQARNTLDQMRPVMILYPGLKIEVAGYTDSKGDSEYNLRLSDKRAQSVIDYLVSPVNPPGRFIKKAFGESVFAAVNTNPDGSDNPEGRKYNRRVTFGIEDPGTGIVIRQETWTPEYLRLPSSIKYSIVIKETKERLPKEHFSVLDLSGMLFLRPMESDSVCIYSIGLFYNRTDAIDYLAYVREKGFTDAFIINHYELNEKSRAIAANTQIINLETGVRVYTIQLMSSKTPVSMDLFDVIDGVKEIPGDDGYFKYVTGEYDTSEQAAEAIEKYRNQGFGDAVVRELNQLIKKEQ